METFSALLAICAGNSPVPGEFPAQRPVTWSFDFFFDLRPNKRLSKQWWGWWFETPSSPLWRHCYGNSLATGRFSHKVQSYIAFICSVMLAWIICWTNSRMANDLRRHDAHVISLLCFAHSHFRTFYSCLDITILFISTWWCHDMGTCFALLTLWEGNPLVTGWFHSKSASNTELWCSLCCTPEPTFEQTRELLVIWDPFMLMWPHCNETGCDCGHT